MTFTFFGTDTDITQVWQWLLDVPGMRVFEASSAPDQANRWFQTWEEVSSFLCTGDRSLVAWPELVGGRPRAQRITFREDVRAKLGGRGRTELASPAAISMNLNNDQMGCLASAQLVYWTEKGARESSAFPDEFLNEVDWKSLQSTVSKTQRLITKSAPAKMRSYPVMAHAFEKLVSGEINLWNWGEPCAYPSPLIRLK